MGREGFLHAGNVVRMDECEHVPAHQVVGGITQNPFVRGAYIADSPVDIENADEIERMLDKGAIVFFAPLQRFDRAPAFGGVAHGTDQ